ncbi:argininosuccinate lyase [Croceiramulus getboli]|nr:argininosuccinate lyase [Flavobacteriaceae bacterium YJPT1-3]
MKLWDKGMTIDDKILRFTVGNDREIDMHIAKYDLMATKAHVKMLGKVDLLSEEEVGQLVPELDQLLSELARGQFVIDPIYEDIHSKIEGELTSRLGDVGKKVHSARSRNDQVLVALHLYYKDSLKAITTKTATLFHTLIDLAHRHKEQLLPGYTHLQVAMPSSFGLWFSSYAELLIDDVYLIKAAQMVVDQNPLGSAAGYGSSFPIDREYTTQLLEFHTLKYNVVAAQMARGKSERTLSAALGGLANTLSRMAMDICLYMSQNFDFISFPDALTTGSSIMPHKKNPDVFELIRGKCNKIQALSNEMILLTNNLPSGYQRDYQLLKESMIEALETLQDILDISAYAIAQVEVKTVDLTQEKYQYLFSVDAVNALVMQGKSFRESYQLIGEQIEKGTYKADRSKKHTHLGSIHNLALDKIREKMNEALS